LVLLLFLLFSTLGNYDGNIYEPLFESVKKSKLNHVDPFDGYEEILKPLLDQDVLKLRNKPISKL
jgi:hypothetical protein